MSHAEERDSSSNTLTIIVCVVGGIVLVGLLVCGGVAYFAIETVSKQVGKMMPAIQDMTQSMQTAQMFLVDLQFNRLDNAYQATSADYQKRTNREAFDALVKRYPALQKAQAVPVNVPTPNFAPAKQEGPAPTLGPQNYVFRVQANDGSAADVLLTVVKVDNAFKVDQFTVKASAPVDQTKDGPAPGIRTPALKGKAEEKKSAEPKQEAK